MKVLVAENGPIVLNGLVAVLEREADVTVVAALDRGEAVVSRAVALRPDVAIVGIDLPGLDGCTAADLLRQRLPNCRTIVISPRASTADVRRAVAAGALGFLLSSGPQDGLVDAIRRVAAGRKAIDADLAFAVLNAADNPLTPREMEVLRLAAEGASLHEMSRALCLATGTVRNHLSRIIGKTGARNRIDAIRIAEKAGWL